MTVMCGWHKRNFGRELFMGVKEPFEKLEVSHGMCAACEEIENKIIDERRDNGIQNTRVSPPIFYGQGEV